MNNNHKNNRLISYKVISKGMEFIYLTLFAAFTIEMFLESTALQWQLPDNYNTIIRILLCIYVPVSMAIYYLYHRKINWFELVFMLIIAVVGGIVSIHINELFLFDTMLLIIGAKNVDYKKICCIYLCITVVLLGLAMYLSAKGYIPDYIYKIDRGARHSLGMCYPTEFMAHIFFAMVVYVCFRERKLTFFEIILMAIIGISAYHWTYARNSTACILILCLICLIIKVLNLFHIKLSNYKITSVISLIIIMAFALWIFLMITYNGDSPFYLRLNELFSSRLQLSSQGFKDYGIYPFGNVVHESGLAFGSISLTNQYFCLDVFFVRVLIKYGCIFAIIISLMYIGLFIRMRTLRKDFILAALVLMVLYGITDYQVFSVAYNPLWLFLFAKVKRGRT